MPNEPEKEFLRRATALQWLKIPRAELEALAELYPKIVYRRCKGAYRYFRKSKLKEVLELA